MIELIGLPPAERVAEVRRLQERKDMRRLKAQSGIEPRDELVRWSLVMLGWQVRWTIWPLPKRLPECGRKR
jgi:hypothetical protein